MLFYYFPLLGVGQTRKYRHTPEIVTSMWAGVSHNLLIKRIKWLWVLLIWWTFSRQTARRCVFMVSMITLNHSADEKTTLLWFPASLQIQKLSTCPAHRLHSPAGEGMLRHGAGSSPRPTHCIKHSHGFFSSLLYTRTPTNSERWNKWLTDTVYFCVLRVLYRGEGQHGGEMFCWVYSSSTVSHKKSISVDIRQLNNVTTRQRDETNNQAEDN